MQWLNSGDKMTHIKGALIIIALLCVPAYLVLLFKDIDNHMEAYNAGYLQGQIDQAAMQKELRKGICE